MVPRPLRVLVTSTLYPPIAYGGYERECAIVVQRLREEHEVLVLTGAGGGDEVPDEPGVRRELTVLTPDQRGSLRALPASIAAARSARRALAFRPDLVYAWNGSSIPQAALRADIVRGDRAQQISVD